MTNSFFDTIGRGYTRHRQPDPRVQAAINEGLGSARTVVNVGAGAGSYEPVGRRVVAVEPSVVMLRQRPPEAAGAVRAVAEHLPFASASVDAALAVLTVHHWVSWRDGIAEMLRVARQRVVILTFDPELTRAFWLVRDYFPGIAKADDAMMPPVDEIAQMLGAQVATVPVPSDCLDGFLGAFWNRPDAYLDPAVRAGISAFSMIPSDEHERGLTALRADLASGHWHRQHEALLAREELDLGYRLLVSTAGGASPRSH